MNTYNILIILALVVLILLLFSNYNPATGNIPIVMETPDFLTPSFQQVGPVSYTHLRAHETGRI